MPLTAAGRQQAEHIGRWLAGRKFSLALESPRSAAPNLRSGRRSRCGLIDANLREWDYGDYEGRTTAEIQHVVPVWSLWDAGPRNGETIAQVELAPMP